MLRRQKILGGLNFRIHPLILKRNFYYSCDEDQWKCLQCHFPLTFNINSNMVVYPIHNCYFNSHIDLSVPIKIFSKEYSLKFESARLSTFKDWKYSWISPDNLALDGFYCLKKSDKCACTFCHSIIENWQIGDIPHKRHQQEVSHCPFLMGEPVGNVPLALCEIILQTNLVLSPDPPIEHPLYQNSEKRQESFHNWPIGLPLSQDLVEAGFFYTGL
ncbi:Apoptosis inhibitor IAP [Astathelohania contejeani]|uniref:Apoptosis inhibitor IAP n=1 Tax=Astathelohania contejeani TaxID=164912 RepID=A0ABQ7HVJ5_9MICR|nr:Apoptosis inhibitor IAP [Thelohania contejeani]